MYCPLLAVKSTFNELGLTLGYSIKDIAKTITPSSCFHIFIDHYKINKWCDNFITISLFLDYGKVYKSVDSNISSVAQFVSLILNDKWISSIELLVEFGF
jgi:hypothetical protein